MELHRTGQAARKAKRVITIKVKHALPVITAREYARSGDATKDPTLRRRCCAIVNGTGSVTCGHEFCPHRPRRPTRYSHYALCGAWLMSLVTQLVSTHRPGLITGSWGIPALGDRRPLDVLKEPGGLEVVRELAHACPVWCVLVGIRTWLASSESALAPAVLLDYIPTKHSPVPTYGSVLWPNFPISSASTPRSADVVLYLDLDGVVHHEKALWHPRKGIYMSPYEAAGHSLFEWGSIPGVGAPTPPGSRPGTE